MNSADVIVIGGGLHGCSAALHLARGGVKVIVLEKDHVARHASGVNAGGVRRLGRHLAEVPLAVTSLAIWQRIDELVGDTCGFESAGQVKVAENEAELDTLRARVAQLQALGFHHEEIIGVDELRALVPALATHCVGAVICRDDGAALPFRAFAIQCSVPRAGSRNYLISLPALTSTVSIYAKSTTTPITTTPASPGTLTAFFPRLITININRLTGGSGRGCFQKPPCSSFDSPH